MQIPDRPLEPSPETTPPVASTPSPGKPDDGIRELSTNEKFLTESMQRLIHFQRQTLALKSAINIETALDTMESLLIEVIDFAYVSLQFRSDSGIFSPIRQICPDHIQLDYSLMEWVMGTQEVCLLPIDVVSEELTLHSLLFMPLGAHHILLLWLEQPPVAFTQEQEALLSILSREMASVLDAHHYRMRLEKSRAATLDIIESVPLGLVSIDHSGQIQMINATAEIALDVKRQEATGADFRTILPRKVVETVEALHNGMSLDEVEIPLGTTEQDSRFLGLTVTPIRGEDGSGEGGHVLVFRDLQLSREVRKLRELDSMKNDFLSLISHELRTPLTSIMAYSEMLLMDEETSISEEGREYISIIHGEGKRLCRLIDDVLDLTRMEAGKMAYTYEMDDPNEIIGTVIMTLNPLMEEKKLILDLELTEDVGNCRLAVDRFTQVITNILSNAIKYTNTGGHVTVTSSKEDPFPNSQIPTLLITIQDDGIGIASENLDRVFSKFEMVESVQNHTSGTGLGMSICKQIIEEGHGGKIWLESELHKGTKVYIQIPIS